VYITGKVARIGLVFLALVALISQACEATSQKSAVLGFANCPLGATPTSNKLVADKLAQSLFVAINHERSISGLPALSQEPIATYVAQLRSDDMANRDYFSHTSPEGVGAFDLLNAYGVPRSWEGENLARNNYPDGESVGVAIRDLMNSPGHRGVILNPMYTNLGVAAAFGGGCTKYFTMIFVGPPF